jgi:hypothetical protein
VRPWYDGPQAAEIQAASDETIAALTARANSAGAAADLTVGVDDGGGAVAAQPRTDDEEAA